MVFPPLLHGVIWSACISSNAKILISGYDNPIYTKLEDNGFKKVLFDVNTIDGNKSVYLSKK